MTVDVLARAKNTMEVDAEYVHVAEKLGEGEFCDVYKGAVLVRHMA